MATALNIGSAAFAFAAAWYWFASARSKLPVPVMYWDAAPPTDPFYAALCHSAEMNRLGALCAGIAAVLTGAATLLSLA